jgi:hypothetical protein
MVWFFKHIRACFALFKRCGFMNKLSGFFLICLVFISCIDEDMKFQIGSRYLEAKTNIRYIDSLTVLSYSVRLDSVRTSGLENLSADGRHHDPFAYPPLHQGSASALASNNARFPSAILLYNYALGPT